MFRATASAMCLFISAFCGSTAHAQSPPPSQQADTGRFDQLIGLSKQSIGSNPEEALKLAHEAERAAGNNALRLAAASGRKGEALLRLGEVNAATQTIGAALDVVERGSAGTALHGELLGVSASIAQARGDYETALASLTRSHDVYQALNDKKHQADSLYRLANIHATAEQYELALGFYQRAGAVLSDAPVQELERYRAVADTYAKLGRIDRSQDNYLAAFARAQQLELVDRQIEILADLAQVQSSAGLNAAAIVTLDKAKELKRVYANSDVQPKLVLAQAEIAFDTGELNKAAAVITALFNQLDASSADATLIALHELASSVFAAQGEHQTAWEHLRAFVTLEILARSRAVQADRAIMDAQLNQTREKLMGAEHYAQRLETEIVGLKSQTRVQNLFFFSALLVPLAAFLALAVSYASLRSSARVPTDQLNTASHALEDAIAALKKKSQSISKTEDAPPYKGRSLNI